MKLTEMPEYIKANKNILNTLICAGITAVFLIIELLFMNRTVIAVLFDIIIPFTATFTFACYAITMASNRPFILICPPLVYFLSLLINQLFSVEVGLGETYPVFTIFEIIPVCFYFLAVITGKLKKPTSVILKIFIGLVIATSVVLVILALFFRITLYAKTKQTYALVSGMMAVLFIYIGMNEQLKIAGKEKFTQKHIKFF